MAESGPELILNSGCEDLADDEADPQVQGEEAGVPSGSMFAGMDLA